MSEEIQHTRIMWAIGHDRRLNTDRRKSKQPYEGRDRRSMYGRRKWFRVPIFVKLAVLSVLQILLIVSIISLTMLEKQKRQYTNQLIEFGVSLIKMTAKNSPDKLLAEEEISLFQLLKDVSDIEQVRYAMIVDFDQQIHAHSQIEKANSAYTPPVGLALMKKIDKTTISEYSDGKESLLLFQHPITYQTLSVGQVILVLSRQSILDAIKSESYFILALTIAGLLVGLGSSVFVSMYFSKPILKLKDGAKVLSKGDFNHRVYIPRNDEMGDLGRSFNQMAIGLGERELIREAFGKYVSPEIRDKILSGDIPLDGERREATLLFSDLRGFTPYVENNEPEEVIKSMRDYFTAMQIAISRHGGLVLQYIGDEIEAVFGVPLAVEDHAERAVRAALDMREALAVLNRNREQAGLEPLRHGIGIYTGVVLAGNTGSKDRLSYTLIGNTVNLASRIQGMTKEVGWDILAYEGTLQRLKESFDVTKETPRSAKGYSKPITVYRVNGHTKGNGYKE
jgi:class 3 adenylate cyclase